jgi:hypothetical protein
MARALKVIVAFRLVRLREDGLEWAGGEPPVPPQSTN